jgi:hypothetical protein
VSVATPAATTEGRLGFSGDLARPRGAHHELGVCTQWSRLALDEYLLDDDVAAGERCEQALLQFVAFCVVGLHPARP